MKKQHNNESPEMNDGEFFLWLHCLMLEKANNKLTENSFEIEDMDQSVKDLSNTLERADLIIQKQQSIIAHLIRENTRKQTTIEFYREKDFKYEVFEDVIARGMKDHGPKFLDWIKGEYMTHLKMGSKDQLKKDVEELLQEYNDARNKLK
jgi:hypothetical protein